MNRLEYLATRDERAALRPVGPSLADALADRQIALIRIRCRADRSMRRWHEVTAFTAAFRRVWFHPTNLDADRAARTDLADMVFAAWPTVDWSRDHQIVVATGEVQAAPESHQRGFIPDDELAFGGSAPVYLACRTVAAA